VNDGYNNSNLEKKIFNMAKKEDIKIKATYAQNRPWTRLDLKVFEMGSIVIFNHF
jgi:hypothetical protein